ncbi:mRNA-decapping enzyme 1B-like [Aulostomus maculatus]
MNEKSTAEPKEIGGSSVLYGNPNLIKPIPVKPNTQESDGTEPKPLSLATLFGSQQHHSSKPDPLPSLSASGRGSSVRKFARPPVARTLIYDSTLSSGKGGNAILAGCSNAGVRAVTGGHTVGQSSVVAGVLQSPTSAPHQQQQQQQLQQPQQQLDQQQHCTAIQKLMQGQRGVGGVGGVLQTVSESPENRLCDNGVPLEHHHHHHHLFHHHQQQHHRHHHQQQQQQQQPPDPIQRLFQPAPPALASLSAAPPCCTIPLPLQQNPLVSAQPIMVDSLSHLQAQQSQQLFFSLSKMQPKAQHDSQSASAVQGTGLLPSQVYNDQGLKPAQGVSSQLPGVVSPHELLHRLQLVQQEQSLASHDPPRLNPVLAPRFLGPTQSQGGGATLGPVANQQTTATAGQKAVLQFQVISPQRIPATVAPTLLLSPSVFSHGSSGSGLSVGPQDISPATPATSYPRQEEIRVLSRSQLQASLLHLIQTDTSFLDTIYEAYVSKFANNSSSKYK